MRLPAAWNHAFVAPSAWRLHDPASAEVSADAEFIRELQAGHRLEPRRALEQYCLLLLNSNEFVYLD